MDTMHYIGFIRACEDCGIEKSAADRLYKAAWRRTATRAGLGFFERLGQRTARSVTGAGQAAKKVKDFSKATAKTVGEGASKAWHTVADPAAAFGTRAGRFVNEAARDIRRGYRAIRPLSPAEEAARRSRSVAKSLAFSPWKATKNFIMRHPVISTVGGITLGAGVTNWANRNSMDDNKSKLPTLTPSEKLMFDRAANGYNLPGLGLDPTFLQGEGLPVYW